MVLRTEKFLDYNRRGDLPESERASKETLALSLYVELEREQIESVVGLFKRHCHINEE